MEKLIGCGISEVLVGSAKMVDSRLPHHIITIHNVVDIVEIYTICNRILGKCNYHFTCNVFYMEEDRKFWRTQK